jgi:hypothetical protein
MARELTLYSRNSMPSAWRCRISWMISAMVLLHENACGSSHATQVSSAGKRRLTDSLRIERPSGAILV